METGGSADAFTEEGTIGIEEEFFVVDDAGRPTSGSDELVYESDPPGILEGRIDHELFKFVLETQTPTISRLADARDTLEEVREALIAHAADHGFQVASAGLHPMARWRELEHARKPRYRSQLDRIQYPQHRNTTAGLHVHVGVDDGDKAVWVANELRWYLPVFLALSANSPYWNGFDTGLASARAKIFEVLPNTGMPTAFSGIDEYLRYEEVMLETGSIKDRGEIWFDARPHTEYGTVEVRTPDAQRDPDRVMAFVEYAYHLVMELCERYEDGEAGNGMRREVLDENKWRACRQGHDATFITPDGTGVVGLAKVVEAECDRLGVNGIQRLLDAGSGAAMQREAYAAGGVDGLCASLLL